MALPMFCGTASRFTYPFVVYESNTIKKASWEKSTAAIDDTARSSNFKATQERKGNRKA